jgi:hypothetical protein
MQDMKAQQSIIADIPLRPIKVTQSTLGLN